MSLPLHQQQHIASWQASGLSQVAYCRQHKLNSKTFSNWQRVHRSQQVASSTPTLIPIEIKPKTLPSGPLCLRSPQGYTLELPADVSPQWLGGLLKCLN
jgi:hypothetical protein